MKSAQQTYCIRMCTFLFLTTLHLSPGNRINGLKADLVPSWKSYSVVGEEENYLYNMKKSIYLQQIDLPPSSLLGSSTHRRDNRSDYCALFSKLALATLCLPVNNYDQSKCNLPSNHNVARLLWVSLLCGLCISQSVKVAWELYSFCTGMPLCLQLLLCSHLGQQVLNAHLLCAGSCILGGDTPVQLLQ